MTQSGKVHTLKATPRRHTGFFDAPSPGFEGGIGGHGGSEHYDAHGRPTPRRHDLEELLVKRQTYGPEDGFPYADRADFYRRR